jgi:hypothetical protein
VKDTRTAQAGKEQEIKAKEALAQRAEMLEDYSL